MEVIKPGHIYKLDSADKAPAQEISFVEGPQSKRITDGTTNEEVIMMLIDRIDYLNGQLPSPFNDGAIRYLRGALECLQARTALRKIQGIEGTNQP